MITKKELIELLNEYSGYTDRSRSDKAIHEDNFDVIADAILSKLNQPTISSSACDHNIRNFKDRQECEKCGEVWARQ